MENVLSEKEQSLLRENRTISHQEVAIQIGDLLIAEDVITRYRRMLDWPSFKDVERSAFARCPECGLDLSKPMGYVCPSTRCPTGLSGPKIKF
jgi:hypothetical protein